MILPCAVVQVCGVDVDEQLVATAANVKWLKSLGFDVQRHNISNDPESFKNYPVAIEKLQKEGSNSLPYILINDELVMSGKYPEKKEWELWIQNDGVKHSENVSGDKVKKEEVSSSSSCCSGPGCC